MKTNKQKQYKTENIYILWRKDKNTKQFYTFNRIPYFMLLKIKE